MDDERMKKKQEEKDETWRSSLIDLQKQSLKGGDREGGDQDEVHQVVEDENVRCCEGGRDVYTPRGKMLSMSEYTQLEERGFLKKFHKAKYPNYITKESRLRSFQKELEFDSCWPEHVKDLVEAGFYYIGTSDHVRCFYCGGGLDHWEPTDDPWIEHARWYSKCDFVISTKGKDFVRMATENFPPILKTEETVSETVYPKCDKIVSSILEVISILETELVFPFLETAETVSPISEIVETISPVSETAETVSLTASPVLDTENVPETSRFKN